MKNLAAKIPMLLVTLASTSEVLNPPNYYSKTRNNKLQQLITTSATYFHLLKKKIGNDHSENDQKTHTGNLRYNNKKKKPPPWHSPRCDAKPSTDHDGRQNQSKRSNRNDMFQIYLQFSEYPNQQQSLFDLNGIYSRSSTAYNSSRCGERCSQFDHNSSEQRAQQSWTLVPQPFTTTLLFSKTPSFTSFSHPSYISTGNNRATDPNLCNDMPPEENKHRNNRATTTAPYPTGAKAKAANSKQKSGNANPGSKPDQMEEDEEKRDDEDAVIEAVTLDATAVEQCCDVKKYFEQDPESIMMMQKEYKKLVGDDEDCYRHQDHPLLQEALARIHYKMPKTQVAPDPSQLQFVAQNNIPAHDILVIIADVAQQKQKAIGFLEEAMVNELLTVTSRLAHTPPKNLFTVKKKMTESTIESACWWCANMTLGSWHAKENKHKRQKKDNTVKSKDVRNFINKTNGADDTSNNQDQEEEKAGSDNDDSKANEPLQTPAKGKGTNRTDVESPQFQLSPKTKKKVSAEEVVTVLSTSSTYKFRCLLLPPEVRTCNVCEINERPLALDAFFTNT